MKKTSRIELLVNIRKTIISFISITMFVFLGTGMYLGMSWSGNTIKQSLEVAFKDGDAHDLQASYIYGISEDDAEDFLQYDNVDVVDTSFKAYEKFDYNDKQYNATITSLTSKIDKATLIEGRYPTREDEILIDIGTYKDLGIQVGEIIKFYGGNGTTNYLLSLIRNYNSSEFDTVIDKLSKECDNLKHSSFKVVGIISHPGYLSNSKAANGVNQEGSQVDALFFCDYSAFNEEVTNNSYNTLLLKSDSLKQILSYKDEFKNKNIEIKDLVFEKAAELNNNAYKKVRGNLDQIIADAKQKIDDGNKKIEQGQIDLYNAIELIKTNEKKIADSEVQLSSAKVQLDNGLAELQSAETQINDGQRQIDESTLKLQAAWQEFNTTKTDINNFFNTFETNISKLVNVQDPPLTNKQRNDIIIEILDGFGSGYSISSIEEKFEENDIEFSDTLKEEIDDYKDDIRDFSIDFTFDLIENLSTLYSTEGTDEKAIIDELKAIRKKVNDDEITRSEAYDLLMADYPDSGSGKSLYKAYFELLANAPGDACYLTVIEYSDDILGLVSSGKTITGKCVDEVEDKLEENDAKLQTAVNELASARTKLEDGKNLYNANKKLYEDGLIQVANGKNQIDQAKKDVEKGKIDLELAKEKLAEAKASFEEFFEKVELIKNYGTSILTREENVVVPYISLIADIVIKLKYSLGGLFLLISVMVCYSVVTRNVNNQIKELGTKKALGFTDREIIISCLAYSVASSVIGSILGVALAFFGIEKIIAPSIQKTFNFDILTNYFSIKEALLISGIELLILVGITYFGCSKILRLNAIKLLQGKQPPETKNRFFEQYEFWKKLPLINKTIVNNCLSDPKRVLATVVGVAGCAALVISSITLKDNIKLSFESQYVDYFKFDSFVYFDQNNKNAMSNIEAYFIDNDITYSSIKRDLGYIQLNGESKQFGYTMVFEDSESFRSLANFDSVFGDFEYKGVWIPESYQKYHNLNPGEEMKYINVNGDTYDTKIDGYYKYYSYMLQIYMDKDTYSDITGEEYAPNMYIISTEGKNYDDVYNDLSAIDGFTSMTNYYKYCKQDCDVFDSISSIMVSVYLIISTLMAVFILLNLFDTFIEEKKRELIVLMINGYSIKQAKTYIYADTIFLTIVGIIIGVIVGNYVGDLSVSAFEGESFYLIHKMDFFAVGVGIAFTAFLSFVMCVISLQKIKKFKLTDINKV